MPLNESKGKPRRERYPLEFDLEGVPRDRATREQRLQSITNPEFQEFHDMSPNSFLSDKSVNMTSGLSEVQKAALLDELLRTSPVGREIDLSKPVVLPYNPHDPKNHYPRLVYNHKDGRVLTVIDEADCKAKQKDGFQTEPSPKHDYSTIRGGVALSKTAAAQAVTRARNKARRMQQDGASLGPLAELDEQDEAAS
jgi:hypothetical protein